MSTMSKIERLGQRERRKERDRQTHRQKDESLWAAKMKNDVEFDG